MWRVPEISLFCLTACLLYMTVRSDDTKDNAITKRAPGWGKRSSSGDLGYIQTVLSDISNLELNKDESDLENEMEKRRPGWGKRSYGDDLDLDKRKPGWGKRASVSGAFIKRRPGWGKRTMETDSMYNTADELVKRRPGWGKRSMLDSDGFGKRAPGWGKRAPGWGKRDGGDNMCRDLVEDIRILQLKLAQAEDKFTQTCNSESLYEDVNGMFDSE